MLRSPDRAATCVFGHLFSYAADHGRTIDLPAGAHGCTDRAGTPMDPAEVFADAVWNVFEKRWPSTSFVYRINGGEHPAYPQPTPQGRVIAHLRALAAVPFVMA
ncbi:hypothetical protein QYM41_08200 [Kocuria sp. CPCC 205268]|uniref:hypothetical protein n=1 Tax=Kocuria oxytropis TaxID=3058913 RepID=UPI0034D75632